MRYDPLEAARPWTPMGRLVFQRLCEGFEVRPAETTEEAWVRFRARYPHILGAQRNKFTAEIKKQGYDLKYLPGKNLRVFVKKAPPTE